jgi:hypothetical protein
MRIEAGIAFLAFWAKLLRLLADGRFLDEDRVAFLLDLDFESSCGFFGCCFFLLVPGGLEECPVLDLLRLLPFSLGPDLPLVPLSSSDVAFGRDFSRLGGGGGGFDCRFLSTIIPTTLSWRLAQGSRAGESALLKYLSNGGPIMHPRQKG